LPSWRDGAAKQSIVTFVAKVTAAGSPDFVPPAERIAEFDNDGTLWAEQPMYFQAFFAFDRVKPWRPSIRSGRRRSLSLPCSAVTSRERSRAASGRWPRWSWSPTPA
jgi:hypothetical protein